METDWKKLADEELLKLRIKDLGLELEHSEIYPYIEEVLNELKAKDLLFQPRIYFGDEWFSPDGQNAVAVPFFLASSRLQQLEKKIMLDCEGDSPSYFKRLFRHELGHAFDHAFGVSKRKLWQKTFGSSKKPYTPESYRSRPYSKNFVHNISDTYAQAHPDEDFAETFAVWLDPTSDWRSKYKNWGAFRKLSYVDRLCQEFRGKPVYAPKGRMLSDAKFLRSTLERYYKRKKKAFEDDYPDFYDSDLLSIFAKMPRLEDIDSSGRALKPASRFMRQQRKDLLTNISTWTKERKITVNQILDKLIDRAEVLELVVAKDPSQAAMELTAFLATLVANYRFTGHFKREV